MPEIERAQENSNALFGKYELGRLLGCGAFAKVYFARNIQNGQSIAVKVINKKKISGSGLMPNVKREITIMSRLNHPHVVKLHEVLATKSKIYLPMELVKGGELFSKISKGRFCEDVSRKYFHQLISAVAYCHSRGVFHRDLKPENLLVDDNGNLKVSDFGLSAVREQIRSDGLLHTLCGTPAYVAPEVLTKRGYDGAKIDVWSCGVILFVMTAGYLPFNDPNLMVMYKKIYKGDYRCPKWMSSDLRRFLSRLLDTNPDTRITIDEILRDPWFRKGYKPTKLHEEPFGSVSGTKSDESEKMTDLNAFDIISFSPGLDLSGLFDDKNDATEDGELFVSSESPEKIMERVEEVAKSERVVLRRTKECGVVLEGQNGNFGLAVEVYRLTESLVVIEAKARGRSAVGLWKNKLRPRLCATGQGTSSQVAGD